MRQRQQGFTIIELLIVAVIVGILGAVAFPAYQNSIRKSCRADAKNALLEIAAMQERNFFQNNQYAVDLSVAGLNYPWGTDTPEGCFTLTVDYDVNGTDCSTQQNCYTISATAVGTQLDDTTCRVFTVNSLGQRRALDDTLVNDTSGVCW